MHHTAGLTQFPWPQLPTHAVQPEWRHDRFWLGQEPREILAYNSATSGWTDDLTDLHAADARTDHPINHASWHLALASLTPLMLRPQAVILDVGCSSGNFIEALRRAFPQASVIGADFLYDTLVATAQRLPGVPFLQFDLQQCPLPDACVDGITALNVLEHIDDDAAALRHIYRILKPGGIAHVEVPAGPQLYDLYDEVLLHRRRYRLSALQALSREIGFVVGKATHLGFWVFPGFFLVKHRNIRRSRGLSLAEKRALVGRQIDASQPAIMRPIFAFEQWLGTMVDYPWGIRAVLTLRKRG